MECIEEEGEQEDRLWMCQSCGEEFSHAQMKFLHYKVGRVESVEELKAPLKKTKVLVEEGAEALQVVTNAKYVKEGDMVVVAMEGAVVPAGSLSQREGGHGLIVNKQSVGGVMSVAMLCDGVMLDHPGGSNGILVNLNGFDYQVGDLPPLKKPRK